MKILGIIGGLGPMASAYFLRLITQMSDADTDQQHMEIVMISKPDIPDRTKYILGEERNSPLPELINVGKKLQYLGADVIAIPCITAHYFHDELERGIGLPVIHAIRETAECLSGRNISKVGIMATDGTLKSALFQSVLEAYNIDYVLPGHAAQQEIMKMIYQCIKAGKPIDMECFKRISDDMFQQGAERILLGCTELSLLKRDYILHTRYLDVMEVLAASAVRQCGRLKDVNGCEG